jgi:DNA-damage-inducible protein D
MQMDTNKELSIRHKQLTLSAKDFADELIRHNVIEKNLNTPTQMLKKHRENNKAVRDILLQRGVRPKSLLGR